MPDTPDLELTSVNSFLIGERRAFSCAGVPGLNPRTLLHQTITLDGQRVEVIGVETYAITDPTGQPFAVLVADA